MTIQAEGQTHRRNCWQCGMEFAYTPVRKHPRFCSDDCRRTRQRQQCEQYRREGRYAERKAAYRPKMKQKICLICGIAFLTPLNATETCGNICGGKLSVRRALEGGYVAPKKFKTKQDRWRHYGAIRRSRLEGSERFNASEIFERDGWRCGLCGRKVDRDLKAPHPMSASLDHIQPLSLGGLHTKANVQLAHLSCNSRKQARAGGQLRLFG